MKIKRIEISNFGILYDIDINLLEENGTLIFVNGSNGRGKTTFLDALKWCIYGDEPIAGKFLSTLALQEAEIGQTISSKVVVGISMDTEGSWAQIERIQLFEKSQNGLLRKINPSEVTVEIRNSAPGSLTQISPNPEAWLQFHFPRRLLNFFLFNGELMARFFDLRVKDNVEDAIRQIAGVDRFENIAKSMDSISSTLYGKMSRLTGSKSEKINIELETHNNLLRSLHEQHQLAEKELREKRERKEELNYNLAGREDLAEASERLIQIDQQILAVTDELRNANEDFQSEVLQSGTTSLMLSAFAELRNQIELAKQQDRLPPPFDPERLRKLLDSKTCICGAHLGRGDSSTKSVEALIEKHQFASEVGKLLSSAGKQADDVLFNLESSWKIITLKNSIVTKSRNQLNKLKDEKNRLLDIIKGNDVNEIRVWGEELKRISGDIDLLFAETVRLETRGEVIRNKVEMLQKQLDEASRGNFEAQILKKQADLARLIAQSARNIHEEAIRTVREKLENSFTAKFSSVKSGKFKSVITEDFEIKILNEFGEETELAEGEKMMKAYAFSIALREIINLSFPLIVDTPFGRLDGSNRAAFAENLVSFLSKQESTSNFQAIFMMHDLEYTPYTQKYFETLSPVETYLGADEKDLNLRSNLGYGIDPDWLKREAWKDWADGKIR